MRYEESHPSDQDLVMTADGELPARRAAAVREHLASCGSCRARMDQIEAASMDFPAFDSQLPPIAGPRAVLRARLAALAAESERSFGSRVWALLACAAVLGALVLVLPIGRSRQPRLELAAVPKPQLTPGATVPVTKQQVCGSSSFTRGPVVPASLQQQVFQMYGITNPRPDAYEIDYLITPDLGGAANIRNLWPQPYDTAWNARVKDQLEERLHSMVCNGEIDLATAQHDLAADWIAAYEKYFHTNRPNVGHPKARYGRPSRYPAMNWRYEVLVARLPVRMSLRRARSLL